MATTTLSLRPWGTLMVVGLADNVMAGSGPVGPSPLHDPSANVSDTAAI
jgi:hypothetical protein